jgi:hypothetical protein
MSVLGVDFVSQQLTESTNAYGIPRAAFKHDLHCLAANLADIFHSTAPKNFRRNLHVIHTLSAHTKAN